METKGATEKNDKPITECNLLPILIRPVIIFLLVYSKLCVIRFFFFLLASCYRHCSVLAQPVHIHITDNVGGVDDETKTVTQVLYNFNCIQLQKERWDFVCLLLIYIHPEFSMA